MMDREESIEDGMRRRHQEDAQTYRYYRAIPRNEVDPIVRRFVDAYEDRSRLLAAVDMLRAGRPDTLRPKET